MRRRRVPNVFVFPQAFKVVYKAYDTEEGLEVAWNKLNCEQLTEEKDRKKLGAEINILRRLNHPNILQFTTAWVDQKTNTVNFITEMMTSGTLRQHVKRVKSVKLKIMKKWSKQIISGLNYLHTQEPPIIHRDLKCDNIFINGNQGDVKLGDFGLSTLAHEPAASIIGTPEFMAPEMYNEHYTSKVDIYAFGMCLLEVATLEYPYCECENTGQIFKKVTTGVKPQGIQKVKDETVRDVIDLCLSDEAMRPSAAELLAHDFLVSAEMPARRGGSEESLKIDGGARRGGSDESLMLDPNAGAPPVELPVQSQPAPQPPAPAPPAPAPAPAPQQPIAASFEGMACKPVESIEVDMAKSSSNYIAINVLIHVRGDLQQVGFTFDVDSDRADTVANEMVNDLQITKEQHMQMVEFIEDAVARQKNGLMPLSSVVIESDATATPAVIPVPQASATDRLMGNVAADGILSNTPPVDTTLIGLPAAATPAAPVAPPPTLDTPLEDGPQHGMVNSRSGTSSFSSLSPVAADADLIDFVTAPEPAGAEAGVDGAATTVGPPPRVDAPVQAPAGAAAPVDLFTQTSAGAPDPTTQPQATAAVDPPEADLFDLLEPSGGTEGAAAAGVDGASRTRASTPVMAPVTVAPELHDAASIDLLGATPPEAKRPVTSPPPEIMLDSGPSATDLPMMSTTVPDGTRVRILGLVKAPEHNGKAGRTLSYDEGKNRYLVQLEEDKAQQLSLQAKNIELLINKMDSLDPFSNGLQSGTSTSSQMPSSGVPPSPMRATHSDEPAATPGHPDSAALHGTPISAMAMGGGVAVDDGGASTVSGIPTEGLSEDMWRTGDDATQSCDISGQSELPDGAAPR